jgi:glutamate-1-semialdehyde aminotransferase
MIDLTFFSTILGSSAVSAVAGAWFGRRKLKADALATEAQAGKTTTDAATATVAAILEWAKMLSQRIESLEKLVAERDQLIVGLRTKVISMELQLKRIDPTQPQ